MESEHSPRLGGRHLQNAVVQHDGLRAIVFFEPFGLPFELREGVRPGAAHRDQGGVLADFLRLIPLVEAEKHVGSHQEIELILGIPFVQSLDGIRRVAGALPAQLQTVHLDPFHSLRRKAQHFQPLFPRRGAVRHVLMGRGRRRNQQDAVQS